MSKLYLRSVRKLLDCPAAERDRLMNRLSDAVAAYRDENPKANYEKLSLAFGIPEACAAHLLEECDPALLMMSRRKKKRFVWTLIAVLVVLLVLTSCYALYMRATGGTVIIETTHYADGTVLELPTPGSSWVEYEYDK